MGRVKNKTFPDDFKESLKKKKDLIEINDNTRRTFEEECLRIISPYANELYNWREKSLRSTTFLG